jgi:hypothetical protein
MFRLLLVIIISVGVFLSALSNAQQKSSAKTIYRYKNSDGVLVLDSKIPPEYVANGYEILSRSGKVIKTVAPAPKGQDAERALQERMKREEQDRQDQQLKRSYSNLADIDAAKMRNLESLRGNITILEANLLSVRNKLKAVQKQAADIERSGRALPADITKNIDALNMQEKDLVLLIKQREEEHAQVAAKFDADRKRFIEISEKPKTKP